MVLNSVAAFLNDLGLQERREAVMKLAVLLSRLSLTTLLTSELDEAGIGVERYASQGIIKLSIERVEGSVKRRLRIVKMTGTMHSMDIILLISARKESSFGVSRNGLVMFFFELK